MLSISPSEILHKLEAEISDLKRRLNTIEHNAHVHILKFHKPPEANGTILPAGLIADEL